MTYAQIDDDTLDPDLIDNAVDRIRAAYHDWIDDPEETVFFESEDAVPIRLIRRSMGDTPREYIDAALRFIDRQDGVEVSPMDEPTDADEDAAVWMEWPERAEECFAHQIRIEP